MELLINSNSNSNSWEILLTIAIAIVPKMSIAIVISILLISSGLFIVHQSYKTAYRKYFKLCWATIGFALQAACC